MKTLKVMSIVGIVWFSLSFVCIAGFMESDIEASAGWGFLSTMYGIAYAIVGLVQAGRWKTANSKKEVVLEEN